MLSLLVSPCLTRPPFFHLRLLVAVSLHRSIIIPDVTDLHVMCYSRHYSGDSWSAKAGHTLHNRWAKYERDWDVLTCTCAFVLDSLLDLFKNMLHFSVHSNRDTCLND